MLKVPLCPICNRETTDLNTLQDDWWGASPELIEQVKKEFPNEESEKEYGCMRCDIVVNQDGEQLFEDDDEDD